MHKHGTQAATPACSYCWNVQVCLPPIPYVCIPHPIVCVTIHLGLPTPIFSFSFLFSIHGPFMVFLTVPSLATLAPRSLTTLLPWHPVTLAPWHLGTSSSRHHVTTFPDHHVSWPPWLLIAMPPDHCSTYMRYLILYPLPCTFYPLPRSS